MDRPKHYGGILGKVDGRWVFIRGKHAGEELHENHSGYVAWALREGAILPELVAEHPDLQEWVDKEIPNGKPRKGSSIIAKVEGEWRYVVGKYTGKVVFPEGHNAALEDYFVWAVGSDAIPKWQLEENYELRVYYNYALKQAQRRADVRLRDYYDRMRMRRDAYPARRRSGGDRALDLSTEWQMDIVRQHAPFRSMSYPDTTLGNVLRHTDWTPETSDDLPYGEGGVMWGDGPNIW